MTTRDVVVLGAGPAGLASAYLLARRGFDVQVVERSSRVGGLAGSFEIAGQRVDHGSHRLHSATPPEILSLLQSLLGDQLQRRVRNGRIRLNGRWLGFPLSPVDLVKAMPPLTMIRTAGSAALASLRPQGNDTFERYVTTGLGRSMGESFYFPYARKIWGVEPAELSGTQARRRISADSPWKVLKRVMAPKNDDRRSFFYPATGFGAISERLAEAAIEAGARIDLDSEVSALDIGEHEVSVTTSDGRVVTGSRLWSTIPIPRLAGLAGHQPTHPLEYRAMVLAYLVVPRAQFTPFDAHYFPEQQVPMTRISEPKNYRDGPDPTDQTVLCAEIPCTVGDELWNLDDASVGDVVADGLHAVDLPVQVSDTVARRLPFAYPIYRVGYEHGLDDLMGWVADQPRLLTLGRQGLFAHDNTHHTLAMAWAASQALSSDGDFDHAAWERSVHGFQLHVVED